jgi:hypothetical protein
MIASLGALAGMVLSWRLWVAPVRNFGPVPVLPWLNLPLFVTAGLIPMLILGMAMGWRVRWGLLAVIAWAVLTAADVMRLQPWVYEYLLIACIAGGRPRASRLVLAGVFLWAGISKLNPDFFDPINGVGPWMTSGLPIFKQSYRILPATEIVAGIALLGWGNISGWTSRILVMGISIGAIVCLVSLRWNTVVWPWQVVNSVLVWLVTPMRVKKTIAAEKAAKDGAKDAAKNPAGDAAGDAAADRSPGAERRVGARFNANPELCRCLASGTICVLLPALCFAGVWPAYLSWRLYDGRRVVPWSLQSQALDELNVPVPPDEWIIRRVNVAPADDSAP